MKTLGTISLAVLLLFVTGSVAAYAQSHDDSRMGQAQEEKSKQNDKDKDKDKPAAKPSGKPAHEEHGMQQDERRGHEASQQPQEKPEREQKKEEKQEQKQQRSEQRMDQDQHHHAAAGKQGKKIPDDKFRANFGRQHTFKVQRTQVINVSQPVVVYSGYSFQLVDAWPVDWGFDDDCYIDYVDGEYFLFNAFHPGVRIAVFVVG